ncbi:MAG: prolipoprotein diacylglyceryl transferase [Hyphomicrobiaceae bacterium]
MVPLTLTYPAIDPVAFSIGPFAVKWYGLAYMAGLLIGWFYVKRLIRTGSLWINGEQPFAPERADDLLLYMTLGVVVGGRLGYVLFYEPAYFLAHPAEIPALWHGGMSFHGGLVGSMLAIWLFARGLPAKAGTAVVWNVLDVAAAATPIGLFFGRLANFINGELWGRPTSVPWAMVFPGAGPVPRHPSQLYEASLEGAALFLILWWLIYRRDALKRPGLVSGVFLAGYGIARSVCELYRVPHPDHVLNIGPLTVGIVYSLPMIAVGAWIAWSACARKPA